VILRKLALVLAAGVGVQPQAAAPSQDLVLTVGSNADDGSPEVPASMGPPSLEESMRLYQDRLDPASLDAALIGLDLAQRANPGDVAVRLLLARAEAFWCDLHAQASASELAAHLSAGVEAAHAAVLLVSPSFARAARRGRTLRDCLSALGPEGAEALYWFGENQHRLAAVRGLAALLLESTDLRAIFGRVAELDPQIDYGGPYRHLAELSLALPYGWSESLKLTEAALQQAIVLGPGFLENHVVYAQRWAVKAQDYARFQAELRIVLDAPEDIAPEIWPENELAKRRARELWSQSSALFARAAITRGLSEQAARGVDGGVGP
jgi:hypothetical protein